MRRIWIGAAVVLMWGGACIPTPSPVPPVTGAGGSSAEGGAAGVGGVRGGVVERQACVNMARLGCPEGVNLDCADTLAIRCSVPKVACPISCLVDATTQAELMDVCGLACGRL